MTTQTKEERWKGFTRKQLEAFGVRQTAAGMAVPYFLADGSFYRAKLFPHAGNTRWLGARKPQIPFGLQRLQLGGDSVILTEGESDAMALALAYPTVPVLGLPGASSWQMEWASLITGFGRVYLCFDADRAGRELTDAVKADVPHYRAILLPAGADTRDLLQRLGKAAFKVLVELADRDWELRRTWTKLDEATKRRRQVELAWEQMKTR